MRDNYILSKIIFQLVLSPPIPERCLYIETLKESNDQFFDFEYDIENNDEKEISKKIKKDENDLFFNKINETKEDIKYINIEKEFNKLIDLYSYCCNLSVKENIKPKHMILNNNIIYLLPEPDFLGVFKSKTPLFIHNNKIMQSINIEIDPKKIIIFEYSKDLNNE